jgi:hypothetical protein
MRTTKNAMPTALTHTNSPPLTVKPQTASDAVYATCQVVVEIRPLRTSVIKNAAS